jgi:hypothetical protein
VYLPLCEELIRRAVLGAEKGRVEVFWVEVKE